MAIVSGLAIAPGETAAERTDSKQVFLFDLLQTKLKEVRAVLVKSIGGGDGKKSPEELPQ